MALGREYIALTDHSKSLGVARGLTDERVREQRQVIDALNERLAPFRIVHGTEMDIKRDGTLDYEDETLAVFEYVSASIHSAMNQERDVMTARIQRALASPWVTTLNHPHGRLVGSREPYAVDMDAVIRRRWPRAWRWRSTASRSGWTWTASRPGGPARPAHASRSAPTAHATRQLDMAELRDRDGPAGLARPRRRAEHADARPVPGPPRSAPPSGRRLRVAPRAIVGRAGRRYRHREIERTRSLGVVKE